MAERDVFLLVKDVDENGVPLIEGSAAAVLSAESNARASAMP